MRKSLPLQRFISVTDGNLLEETPKNCNVLQVNNPILTNTDLMKIKSMKAEGFKVETVPITYYKNTSLEKAIDRLFVEVDRAFRDGVNIIILSDRGVDENHVAIPSLLAVSALQQHLVTTKKRTSVAIILETCRAERGTSLCDTVRLWCLCDQSVSGTGVHQGTDRQPYAG